MHPDFSPVSNNIIHLEAYMSFPVHAAIYTDSPFVLMSSDRSKLQWHYMIGAPQSSGCPSSSAVMWLWTVYLTICLHLRLLVASHDHMVAICNLACWVSRKSIGKPAEKVVNCCDNSPPTHEPSLLHLYHVSLSDPCNISHALADLLQHTHTPSPTCAVPFVHSLWSAQLFLHSLVQPPWST